MRASVIIPARNAAATLPAALAALAGQETEAAYEVLVVDDGSHDGTAAIASAGPGVRVIRGHGRGPASARNLGAAEASGDLLAFTDADCVPEPTWLAALVAASDNADLVQGCVLPPEEVQPGPYDRFLVVTSEYGLYETANLAIRRDLFLRLGGFQSVLAPRRGMELGEDVWLGWRARRAGARTTFAGAAVVRHAVFPRGPRGYIAERARLRFFPQLVKLVPELRDEFVYRRRFLNVRTAYFDLALLGLAAAVLARRPEPLGAVAPYGLLTRRSVAARSHVLRAVAVEAVADGVGATALLFGSLRSRALLL